MDFAGEFETHLTVRLGEVRGIDALMAWAKRRGVKCVHILLARGETASQPMLTRRGRGVLSGELAAAADLASAVEAAGFPVVRTKVEASPWNEGVPQTDEEAAGQPADRHFEHHVRLVLGPDADLSALEALARSRAGHLSRNALRRRDDGREERFVTQRCYGVGQPAARRALGALVAALESAGYEVADVEEEFVVYDSNAALDAGWIDGSDSLVSRRRNPAFPPLPRTRGRGLG